MKTFDQWYKELKQIAKENKVAWLIPPKEDYPRDAYEDGISPSEAFWDEVSYAIN